MNTPKGQVPEALRPIQRYKIGYHSDDWGQRSSTPSGIPDASGSWVRYADHVAALAAGQAVAPVTRIPLATGGELCFEPYVIGSPQWLWALRRDNAFIRYLGSFEQEFVNAAVRATRPAPPAMDGGEDARWLAERENVLHSFWVLLGEAESQADNNDDRLLKHQVEGFHRQLNALRGSSIAPRWVERAARAAQKEGEKP